MPSVFYLQGDQEVTDSGFNKHTEPISYDGPSNAKAMDDARMNNLSCWTLITKYRTHNYCPQNDVVKISPNGVITYQCHPCPYEY